MEVINQGDYHRAMAVTDKYLGEEPNFVEVGHSMPSLHSDNQALRDIAERACHALGIRYGVAHFEARITPAGEIKIIEVGRVPAATPSWIWWKEPTASTRMNCTYSAI